MLNGLFNAGVLLNELNTEYKRLNVSMEEIFINAVGNVDTGRCVRNVKFRKLITRFENVSISFKRFKNQSHFNFKVSLHIYTILYPLDYKI